MIYLYPIFVFLCSISVCAAAFGNRHMYLYQLEINLLPNELSWVLFITIPLIIICLHFRYIVGEVIKKKFTIILIAEFIVLSFAAISLDLIDYKVFLYHIGPFSVAGIIILAIFLLVHMILMKNKHAVRPPKQFIFIAIFLFVIAVCLYFSATLKSEYFQSYSFRVMLIAFGLYLPFILIFPLAVEKIAGLKDEKYAEK